MEIINRNFQKFGVRDQIRLVPRLLTQETAPEVLAKINTRQISALMHDADGRVDRDFAIFWPMLRDNGLIIVDDYFNYPEYKAKTDYFPDGGTKLVTTYRLLNQLIKWNLFEPECFDNGLVFGRKPPGADFSRLDLDVCERIVSDIEQEREDYIMRTGSH